MYNPDLELDAIEQCIAAQIENSGKTREEIISALLTGYPDKILARALKRYCPAPPVPMRKEQKRRETEQGVVEALFRIPGHQRLGRTFDRIRDQLVNTLLKHDNLMEIHTAFKGRFQNLLEGWAKQDEISEAGKVTLTIILEGNGKPPTVFIK